MGNPAIDQTSYNYCALPLAAYACRPDQSQGRVYKEPESLHRTPFQRDRDRIIHSSAFRRLKDKTQVFVNDEGDHFRTRLTHTLEVAQVTRTLARALMVNEDLAESIALAHDLGHTPFAHIGEEFLDLAMKDYGGFDHNDQSLRVLTTLERRYTGWDGLNMSWETLEGVVKHNGPVEGKPHIAAAALQEQVDLGLNTHASLEAQVAALSDDIAYNNHDVEDGLRAGLFDLADLEAVTLLRESLKVVHDTHKDIARRYVVQEMIREMIGAMVDDVLVETKKRLTKIDPQSANDIRGAGIQIVAFSDGMKKKVDELRGFLFERMYKHYTMNRIRLKVERIVGDLFQAFHRNYQVLPDHWQSQVEEAGGHADEAVRARVIADYVAGMTDRYAIREHERLFDLYWDLR
ncbi:MAG: deoxyguanosinetriphosphate triphosphohydrolase-like protein [Micavibrio sp.]|nr:MAG: deoxyguanosinetriphosphate triphosphohydrolase-like protein [Micavibrio sp.]